MSFKGEINARCPGGCEPFDTEVWSFISADADRDLRELVAAREINLLLCPHCGSPFLPEEPYVYFERSAELLAFVFPESYREKEEFWRGKMREDFLAFKKGMGAKVSDQLEPQIHFGVESLGALLEAEDYRGEEREVMEFLAGELGLALYRVSPQYAREHGIPSALPYAGSQATRESVIAGLEKLVAANDRLASFGAYLKQLRAAPGAGLPPAPH